MRRGCRMSQPSIQSNGQPHAEPAAPVTTNRAPVSHAPIAPVAAQPVPWWADVELLDEDAASGLDSSQGGDAAVDPLDGAPPWLIAVTEVAEAAEAAAPAETTGTAAVA